MHYMRWLSGWKISLASNVTRHACSTIRTRSHGSSSLSLNELSLYRKIIQSIIQWPTKHIISGVFFSGLAIQAEVASRPFYSYDSALCTHSANEIVAKLITWYASFGAFFGPFAKWFLARHAEYHTYSILNISNAQIDKQIAFYLAVFRCRRLFVQTIDMWMKGNWNGEMTTKSTTTPFTNQPKIHIAIHLIWNQYGSKWNSDRANLENSIGFLCSKWLWCMSVCII